MNIYNFHTTPYILDGYASADLRNPVVFMDKYYDDPYELKLREKAIATSAIHSYNYA